MADLKLALSPDGTRLATWDSFQQDFGVKVWDATTGGLMRTFGEQPPRRVMMGMGAVAFSPDGHRLVVAGRWVKTKLWDVGTGRELADLGGGINQPFISPDVTRALFSPDGARLVTLNDQGVKTKLWDAGTGREVATLDSRVRDSLFSPDGRFLATTSSMKDIVTLWDAADGREVRTIEKTYEGPRLPYVQDSFGIGELRLQPRRPTAGRSS